MAGFGNRFKDAGYRQEKFEIEFRGHRLLDWSLASLLNFRDFELILIARNLPGISQGLNRSAAALGFERVKVIVLDEPTRGQAETAARASIAFEEDDSILIFNTDTFIDPSAISPNQIRGEGWIPTFRAEGAQWSFVDADENGMARRTTEKARISEHCSVGMYYFSSFRGYCDLVGSAFWEHELYVAPLYNEWIAAGHPTYIQELPDGAVTVLGTPADLAAADRQNRPNWPEGCE